MQEKWTELLEKILKSYEAYFDISRETEYEGVPVAAEAAFHSRSEKYVLVKKAQLWAAEAHEYTFFLTAESLDCEKLEAYREVILKEGLSRVKPQKDHMYTYVTMIVIADQVDERVSSQIRRMRFHKSYRLSIHGWCDLRVAICDMSGETVQVLTNPAGRELRKMVRAVTDKKRRAKR